MKIKKEVTNDRFIGCYEEAIKRYSLAVRYDPDNGNRYYDLGFALATHERLADALKI